MERKYGVWILPPGEMNQQLQALIDGIAKENGSIKFIPHISIAGLSIKVEKLDEVKGKIDVLAKKLGEFAVKLDEFGAKEEAHRCLYLLAKSGGLEELFQNAVTLFPDAIIERNRSMPHLSVMYGNYPEKVKREIIAKHPSPDFNFTANGLDLCISDGREDEWHSIYHSSFKV